MAPAQALPNLSLLRVRYNTAKNSAKPAGELKAQLDEVDRSIAEASRLGRNGELRRLIAKGLALLDGRAWTPEAEYRASLVLRADRVFADAAQPFTVRLEQIYAPGIELSAPPSATVTLRPLLAQPAGTPETSVLASVADIPRDLRESPLVIDLDVSKAPDGPHELVVEISQRRAGGRPGDDADGRAARARRTSRRPRGRGRARASSGRCRHPISARLHAQGQPRPGRDRELRCRSRARRG